MFGAQIVIGVVNELVDVDLDRAARPDKPLVSGKLVSRQGAVALLVGAAAVMLVAGATLGIPALLVRLLGCALGIAYSLWLKRTLLAFLPYMLAIPLLPIWVALAHDELDGGWLLLFPIGASALAGVQIAHRLPDIDSDRAAGIRSLTTVLGERRAMAVCWCLLLTSAAIGVVSNSDEPIVWTAALCVGLGVALNAWVSNMATPSGATGVPHGGDQRCDPRDRLGLCIWHQLSQIGRISTIRPSSRYAEFSVDLTNGRPK